MQRLTIVTHFRGTAAEPSGEPPQTDPRASSVSVEVVQDDGPTNGVGSRTIRGPVGRTLGIMGAESRGAQRRRRRRSEGAGGSRGG